MLKVGLQLYTIRDEIAKDINASLKAVKEMGYDYVELAGSIDLPAEEIKAIFDKYGLECVSMHKGYAALLENEKELIEMAKTLGSKYIAISSMPRENHAGTDAFKQTIENYNHIAKAFKAEGIQLLYHNHEYEFEQFDGKCLLDWLYDSIDSELLKTQLDTCWVKYAGHDPVKYINKYSGRAPIVHLKDFTCQQMAAGPVYELIDDEGKKVAPVSREERGFDFKPIGYGVQDIPAILKASEDAGAEYVIVEQDSHNENSSLENARLSREYLKSLGI